VKPQQLLGCMLFRGMNYITRQVMSTKLEVIFVMLFRGIAGGFLFCYLAKFIFPAMTFMNVIHSIWFYIIAYLVGLCYIQWAVWTLLILWPMRYLGVLDSVVDSIEGAIAAVFGIAIVIIWAISQSISHAFSKNE